VTADDDLRTQVRAALKASGMKQAAIAARLGVTEKHLSQMLTGRVRLPVRWADAILAECGSALRFTVEPGTPPKERAGASSATTALPDGPALLYVGTDGVTTRVDLVGVTNRRERRLYRALVAQAGELADKADERDEHGPQHPVGFTGPSGVSGPE
jgi:DNA-binding transcriptional regulator YdaS (Cro superfamily)